MFTPQLVAGDWPSFRGTDASGIAKGAHPPLHWNGETGQNIRWKTAIPGLGHSSPVITGDRVLVTTAVGEKAEPYLRVGLYGESPDHPEDETFEFKVYCIDKNNGRVLWERVAYKGKPKVKRHIKSSHANPTIATNGKVVLAFFGSEGLYCYDLDGKLLWQKDLGYLDAGAFNAPEIQWGFGNSPTIYKDRAIVLCDVNNQSFLTMLDLKTGEEIWRRERDENATWCTPTVVEHKGKTQIIVNGYKHIGAYDLDNGEEIWKLKGGGDIPVPTAVVADDMVFITNAHGPMRPIYAISLDATGDISLEAGQTSNDYVVWSHPRRGAYMPTPLVLDDLLYLPNNRGILTCFEAKTGKVVYRERIAGRGGSYSASPIAANGHLYFSDEEGDIHVIKAGADYKHVGSNPMGGLVLATPAIVDDMLIVRTSRHLYGVGDTGGKVLVDVGKPKAKAEPVKVEKKEEAPLPKLDPNNPVSILQHVDAASRKVTLVRYSVRLQGLGAMAARGSAEMTLTTQGYQQGLPQKFKAEGTMSAPGMPAPRKISCGGNGEDFYAVDYGKKMLHRDLEFSVIGSSIGPMRQALFVEFHHPQPFNDEITSPEPKLAGSAEVGGEDCWEIHVSFAQTPDNKTIWYLAKSDLLPRGRKDLFKLQNGDEAGFYKEITKLEVSPELPGNWAGVPKLEGFEQTDEAIR